MKVIKFRFWDAIEKRYLSWEEIQESTIQDVFGTRILTPQQWTGLADRSGKEIYEGDILTHRIYTKVAVVDLRYFFSTLLPGVGKWNWYGDAAALGFEIIGNIHENADLFEEQE